MVFFGTSWDRDNKDDGGPDPDGAPGSERFAWTTSWELHGREGVLLVDAETNPSPFLGFDDPPSASIWADEQTLVTVGDCR